MKNTFLNKIDSIISIKITGKNVYNFINKIIKNKINILITVGKEAKAIANTVKDKNVEMVVYSFDNNIDAINLIKKYMKENDVILVKASNGMHFEEIVDGIK